MRNVILCVLLVMAAFVWASCSDPVKTATRTIDTTTQTVMQTQVQYRKLVGERLLTIAEEEKNARTTALAKGGCNMDPEGPQPTPECAKVVADSKARYDGRKGKVVGVATKLDAATGAVYAALLTAVDVLIIVRDGAKDQWPKLAALVAEAVKVAETLANAWADFKKNAASY